MQKSTLDKIKSIVGSDNFMDSIEDKLVYSYDGTPLISHKPEAISYAVISGRDFTNF